MLVVGEDRKIRLPALTTAHSHAFQRAMRGTSQQKRVTGPASAHANEPEDFWTWRGQMYRLAMSLTPESIDRISRVAFRDLRLAGIRTVGEFHYIHHQADGTPYDDRTLLADIVIAAAKAEGLRVSLLRTVYNRAGAGLPPEPGQKRFCDPDVDVVLRDVDRLRVQYKDDPLVRVGIAPHSVRAVPPSWIAPLAAYAEKYRMPFHMHVAEQPREIEECVAETGRRPMDLLDELGALSDRFVAVHATHLSLEEATRLGKARGFACVCATTERDLADGLPNLTALRDAGARLCTGIDSHVITDPIDDLRALETHERLRTMKRVTFTDPGKSPAESLWASGSIEGARACGFEDAGGVVVIDRDHPSLELVEDHALLDAIVFSGSPAIVRGIESA